MAAKTAENKPAAYRHAIAGTADVVADPEIATARFCAKGIRELPILFNGEMVRAILDDRKTNTRRLAHFKPRVEGLNFQSSSLTAGHYFKCDSNSDFVLRSRSASGWEDRTYPLHLPYAVGDLLYVRETWTYKSDDDGVILPDEFYYAVDPREHEVIALDEDGGFKWNKDGTMASPWKPSIHMPKHAARIWLRVTSVKVERVNQITEEDARREGIDRRDVGGMWLYRDYSGDGHVFGAYPIASFQSLWDSLYGKTSPFESGPWVAAYTFERIKR